ncbi:phytoene desaturase family protein [Corynebacterium sp. 335C]
MTATTYDHILIGAGHNALVAAANLAENSRRVLVLERSDGPGGALRSSDCLGEGYVADLYATNLNLFLGNPGFQRWKDKLAAHGVEFATTDRPYANAFPDGTALKVYGDVERTREGLRAHSEEDLAGFDELYAKYKEFIAALMPLYGAPMPVPSNIPQILAALRSAGMRTCLELGQIVLSSTRELADRYFTTREAKALIAPWGMHMDFGPEVSGGAMFPFLEVYADMENGMTLGRGAGQTLIDGLVSLVEEFGGEVRCNAEVTRILTEDGRAAGVELGLAPVGDAAGRRGAAAHRRGHRRHARPRPRGAGPPHGQVGARAAAGPGCARGSPRRASSRITRTAVARDDGGRRRA